MIKTEFRTMSAREKAEFERILREAGPLVRLKTPAQCFGAFMILLLFAVFGFLLGTVAALLFYLISKVFPPAGALASPSAVKVFHWAGALLGAAGIPVFLWAVTKKGRRRYARRLKEDLRDGRVEVVHVTTSDAVRRELADGEQWFFINAGEGKVLFLCGDHLAEPVSCGHFPTTEFELVRGPHSRLIIDMKCLGKPFEARRQLLEIDDDCCFPVDGEILDADLNDLEKCLKKSSSEKSAD